MSSATTPRRKSPPDVLAEHLPLAMLAASASSSAAGVFIARAARAKRGSVRVRWALLAALELFITVGIIQAVVTRRRRQRP